MHFRASFAVLGGALVLSASVISACGSNRDDAGGTGGSAGGGGASQQQACEASVDQGCAPDAGCCQLVGNTVVVDTKRACKVSDEKGVLAACSMGRNGSCLFNPAGYCYYRTQGDLKTVVLSYHYYPGGLVPEAGWKSCQDNVSVLTDAMAHVPCDPPP